LDWALISVAGLLFVTIAYATKRSSWAVLGAIGLFLAASHYAAEWSNGTTDIFGLTTGSDWVPYPVFAFLGFLLVALGLRSRGRAGVDQEPRI
jgi:hypothetical protein